MPREHLIESRIDESKPAHAVFSASGSETWLNCSAALAMQSLFGAPDTGSTPAREGTAAHYVGSECLINDEQPSGYFGDTIKVIEEYMVNGEKVVIEEAFTVNQEMVDAVEVYVNYVRGLNGSTNLFEVKVDYSHIAPEGSGTADALVETVEKVDGKPVNTLYVCDFKYGAGIYVDAYQNSQGKLYGVGALRTFEFIFKRPIERIVIVIIQPRKNNISEFEISPEELERWAQSYVKLKATLADDLLRGANEYDRLAYNVDKTFSLKPGCFTPTKKGCQWCGVKGTCKALAAQGYEAAIEGFEDMTDDEKLELAQVELKPESFRSPNLLDNDELAAIRSKIKAFVKWAKSLDVTILEKLKAGEAVPGLKAIREEGKRAWKGTPAETIAALRTAGLQKKDYELTKIIGPSPTEKKLKEVKPKDHKKRFAKLTESAIHKPLGEPKIVAEHAKGESLYPVTDFEDLNNNQKPIDKGVE